MIELRRMLKAERAATMAVIVVSSIGRATLKQLEEISHG